MQKIIGRKPVLEALNSGKDIDRIILSFGQKGDIIDSIRVTAKKRKIKLTQLSPHKFKGYEKGLSSQGVIAFISDYNFWKLDALINQAKKNESPLILILDEIQDTHNIGAIFRTAESVGVDGVIVTTRNSAPINETVEKTSAGAISHLRISPITNLRQAMETLKQNGFWIVGSSLTEKSKLYTEIDYSGSIAIVVGNEEKGIRKHTAEFCDHLVKIPMQGKVQSLNVSVATGVLLFEVLRQRNN
ncbi:23S rRNA (guanosine(2251)-2'-O)-methyltransferase [hydrothermal vent metagenome]|uniref:23S rRNA (Guanosine(2251)-2'-O)-methyltransferase n=1 Tax=hydrothermal vent metagenome TaxID=652676 RepID=A0A3B1CNF8_9ZZZZ